MIFRSFFGELPFLRMAPDDGDMGGSGGGGGGNADGAGAAGDGAAGAGDQGGSGDGANGASVDKSGAGNGASVDKSAGDAGAVDKLKPEPKLGADGKPITDAKPDAAVDKGIWDEKWREAYAGDDTKKLAQLKRYESPKAALDALFAAQEKIRTGQAKDPLPKDAKPEEVAAWRKANGIPEKPEGYLEKLPEGVVLGDDDKEGFSAFVKDMHELNAPPELVHKAVAAYQKRMEEHTLAVQAQDNEQKNATIAALTQEFGPEYAANIQSMRNFIAASFPKEVTDQFLSARLGDGTALFNHPDMIRSLVRISRELNPTGTPTPGTGFDKADEVEAQIKKYESRMGKKEWFDDEKSQAHYRELIDARERYKTKQK